VRNPSPDDEATGPEPTKVGKVREPEPTKVGKMAEPDPDPNSDGKKKPGKSETTHGKPPTP
jgi:hypothetical protein